METEHSEPEEEEEEEELFSRPGLGSIRALTPGASQASITHMGSLGSLEVRGPVGINTRSPPKPGHFLLKTQVQNN